MYISPRRDIIIIVGNIDETKGAFDMNVMTTKEAAELWGVTVRHVQSLCDRGLIEGATKVSDVWLLPKDAQKPLDGRTKAAKASK